MLSIKKLRTALVGVQSSRLFLSALPEEKRVKVGKYNINYLKVGTGRHNLFCAPGALGTIWTEFKPQIEGFDREKFTVVVWDPPGYGKSYPPEREFTIDFLEKDADLLYEFMKVLEIPKFSILGFSNGGVTSLIFAAKYPAVINKLVVWAVNSYISPAELEAYKLIGDVKNWPKKHMEPMIEIYGKERFERYCASWYETKVKICQIHNGNVCSDRLKDIKCPTFILRGEKDPFVESVQISHFLKHIDDARTHFYPEGKHHIHLAYADDFNKRVQDFLLLN